MRKLSLNLLLFLLLICLAACNGDIDNNVSNVNVSDTPITQTEIKLDNKSNESMNTSSLDKRQDPDNKDTNQNAKDILSMIPVGWHILEKVKGEPAKVEGDLNKDGIPDIAVVIEGITKTEEAAPRALIIAFGNKDKTYSLSIKAEKAVLRANEGGVWGDPFERISIERGSVLLSYYGGSNWRWYSSYRFRFQDKDWYLIGATLGSYFTGTTTQENADEEDYNLLTGDYIIRKADEKGNLNTTKGNRGIRNLVKLKDFIVNSEKKQF